MRLQNSRGNAGTRLQPIILCSENGFCQEEKVSGCAFKVPLAIRSAKDADLSASGEALSAIEHQVHCTNAGAGEFTLSL